jgi:hypothetical protein
MIIIQRLSMEEAIFYSSFKITNFKLFLKVHAPRELGGMPCAVFKIIARLKKTI